MSAFLAHAPVAWYVARASGLVAFGILTLSVWLGLATSTRVLGRGRQKHVVGWHQTLAWTGLSAIALHAVSLLFDPTLNFGLSSVLVPLASAWRPGAVAAGVVAGWLTLTLATSFRMRKRIGQKGWRRLHYASFAAFLLTVGHALTAGTDLRGVSGLLIGGIAMAPVVWLGLFRILAPRTPARPAATPGAAPA
jgi:methionine sulfoxide reductase heme-binding subunit